VRWHLGRFLQLVSAHCLLAVSAFPAQVAAEAGEKPLTCNELQSSKPTVYGFHLAQLNESQIDAKAKQLEVFWKQVEAAGPMGTNCLREMLESEKTDHYFQFEAASWLYHRDKSPATLTLIRDSISQADFEETDPANYLTLALALSQSGVDIHKLAARLLRFPHPVIQITDHGLDLDVDTSALFLYGSMPPAEASKALDTELLAPEQLIRSEAAHLLAEQMTAESYSAMARWDGLPKIEEEFRRNDIQAIMKYQPLNEQDLPHPKFNRQEILAAIAGLPHTRKEFDERMSVQGAAFDQRMRESNASQEDLAKAVAEGLPIYGIANHTAFINSAIVTLRSEDFDTVREARRKSLHDVSDESLEEYLAFTRIMIGMINHLDLFKEYRAH